MQPLFLFLCPHGGRGLACGGGGRGEGGAPVCGAKKTYNLSIFKVSFGVGRPKTTTNNSSRVIILDEKNIKTEYTRKR